jgi:FkbM family methyltransferase
MNSIFKKFAWFSASLVTALRTVWWDYIICVFQKEKKIHVYDSTKFIFSTYGDIPNILYSSSFLCRFKRSFEYGTFEILSKTLKPGNIVLDIGANVGAHALFMAKIVGNTGRVYAFEPDKMTFDALKRNIDRNGYNETIIPFNLALSDKDSEVILKKPHTSSKKNTGDAYNYISAVNEKSENSIKAVVLDDFLAQENILEVNFIKIDVEGAELLVFNGASKLLEEKKPTIITECNEDWCERFGYTVFDVLKKISTHGYSIKNYDYEQWIAKPISTDKI